MLARQNEVKCDKASWIATLIYKFFVRRAAMKTYRTPIQPIIYVMAASKFFP